jgi:hypothetical protein
VEHKRKVQEPLDDTDYNIHIQKNDSIALFRVLLKLGVQYPPLLSRQDVSGSNESPQSCLGVSGSNVKCPSLLSRQDMSGSNEVSGSKSSLFCQSVSGTNVSESNGFPQSWQGVSKINRSFQIWQGVRNSYSLLRISDHHLLLKYEKGNFTSSYLQIWKCSSNVCSFHKPIIYIIKEIYFKNIPSIYQLYSIAYFTHSVSSDNRLVVSGPLSRSP